MQVLSKADMLICTQRSVNRCLINPVSLQICDEMQKQLEMCEFVYYWSRERWCIELLEEVRGGYS